MLLKFGYDGTKFYGYQRQPGVPTVEGTILSVLRKYKIADSVSSASRTDRGVSAVGNVIRVDTEDDATKVIGILNANLKHIFFHSYAYRDVPPRFAEERWYRYHLLDLGYSIESLNSAARIFEGTHDFRNFTRCRDNTTLTINSIAVRKESGIFIIDFRARYYLWNVIRRIVAAMVTYASGSEFDERVFDTRGNFGLAAPEPLVLMDVRYNFEFEKYPVKKRVKERLFNNFSGKLVYYYMSQ